METKRERIHPLVKEAQEQLNQGRISRREFLRYAMLLGTSSAVAYTLAACGVKATPSPTAASTVPPTTAPVIPIATTAPVPTNTPLPLVKRGGTLIESAGVVAADHPARFSLVQASNVFRHAFGYLAITGNNNLTTPDLLEKYDASDDLKTWTLHIRHGMKWTNGDEFNATDVVFNFKQWFDSTVGSSLLGTWQGYLSATGVETVDNYTVVLHLDQAKLDVAETLSLYQAMMVHHNFGGDITNTKEPSLMYMVLKEYLPGERAVLTRRTDYWENGLDGQPLPYLDGITYIDMGGDQTSQIVALLSGDIASIYSPTAETYLALKNNSKVKVKVQPIETANVIVLRMRSDQGLWSDNNLRQALKMCQDRQKILQNAYFGEGQLAHDTHVAPVHPEYYPYDIPQYDPVGAKALLAKAGHPNGLDATISVVTDWPDNVAYATTLAESCKPAGINLKLDTMPSDSYWNIWTTTPLGITSWSHRPLGVQVLALAYAADAKGNPVPWNETHWVDAEFNQLLTQALATLDIEARKAIFKNLEQIQMERGSVGVSYWMNQWAAFNPAYQNLAPNACLFELWKNVWYDPDKDPFKSS